MVKIVFLDIDGVLNSSAYLQRCPGAFDGRNPAKMIDDLAVVHLNRLIKETEAACVISSTWRIKYGIFEIGRALRARGFVGNIIGKTPQFGTQPRGVEIAHWLSKSPADAFVILDDDADMAHLMSALVKTSYEYGLTAIDVDSAIEILNK